MNKKILWLLACGAVGSHAASPVGLFEDHADVGAVLHAGSAEYDTSRRSYTVSGSGENLWAAADAFHFVWKRVSGDVTLAADIAFVGSGGNAHRKAVLMIRQSLDTGSAYGDAALHGNGLTSLQSREEKGAATHEIQSNVSAPSRLRIEKRGDYVLMSVARAGEELQRSGGWMRVRLEGPFYVGIGVCAHDKDVVEKAVFSNVDLVTTAPAGGKPVLWSTLETIILPSTDRHAVYTAPERIEAPSWTTDGAAILFSRGGRILRVPAEGGKAETVDGAQAVRPGGPESVPDGKYIYFHSDRAGAMQIWRRLPDGSGEEQITSDDFNNCCPDVSSDGRRMAFLSYDKGIKALPEDKEVTLRMMSLGDKKISVVGKLVGGKGTLDVPSWSPDGRRLAFVSYQFIP